MNGLAPIAWIPASLKRAQRVIMVRLSTLSLIVGATALLASVVLGVMYWQQLNQQESLRSQVTAATESLTEYGSAASLEEQLAAAEARLMAEQAYLPDSLGSNAILDSVLQAAEESQVTIVGITTQPEEDKEWGNYILSGLSIELEATGSPSEIEDFVNKLGAGALKTVSVHEISITEMTESPVVTLDISVYVRR